MCKVAAAVSVHTLKEACSATLSSVCFMEVASQGFDSTNYFAADLTVFYPLASTVCGPRYYHSGNIGRGLDDMAKRIPAHQ